MRHVKSLHIKMDRIEEILNEKGLSKAAFAVLMGTTRQNVNALLRNPTRAKLEQIASVLQVPIWQLFVSPDEVLSQEFISFFYHKGKTHTPTTMNQVMDVLMEWNKLGFYKLCQTHFFNHIDEVHGGNKEIMQLKSALCSLLDIGCDTNPTQSTQS